MTVTTIDYQKLHDWRVKRLYCHFRLSVVGAVVQAQFLGAGRGRKPQIFRWNCHPVCCSSRYISITVFGGHIAISGCRSLSQSVLTTLYSDSSWSKISDLPWNFDAICRSFGGITTSGFGGHIAISGCRSMLWTLVDTFCSSPWSKTSGLSAEL